MSLDVLSSHSPFRIEDAPEPQMLADSGDITPYEGKLGAGTLAVLLEVFACTKYNSCSKIEATFVLTLDEEGSEAVEVGYAIAHIIDKTIDLENSETEDKGKRKKLWLTELVQTDANDELPTVMRTIFGNAGGVRSPFKRWAGDLREADRMVYLDMLKIHEDFRGCGLGPLALEQVHALLNDLSNGYAFAGPFILWASTPTDVATDFEDLSQYEQESKLIKFYKSMGYDLWTRRKENGKDSMTIMGGLA